MSKINNNKFLASAVAVVAAGSLAFAVAPAMAQGQQTGVPSTLQCTRGTQRSHMTSEVARFNHEQKVLVNQGIRKEWGVAGHVTKRIHSGQWDPRNATGIATITVPATQEPYAYVTLDNPCATRANIVWEGFVGKGTETRRNARKFEVKVKAPDFGSPGVPEITIHVLAV